MRIFFNKQDCLENISWISVCCWHKKMYTPETILYDLALFWVLLQYLFIVSFSHDYHLVCEKISSGVIFFYKTVHSSTNWLNWILQCHFILHIKRTFQNFSKNLSVCTYCMRYVKLCFNFTTKRKQNLKV